MSESSTAQNTSSFNTKVKVESSNYDHLISANHPVTKTTDSHAPATAPFAKAELLRAKDPVLTAPHTEELVQNTHLTNGLLGAEADQVPHIHYHFTNTNSLSPKATSAPTISSSTRRRRSRKDSKDRKPNHRLSSGQETPRLAHLRIFTRHHHCPSVAPRAPGATRPLIKFYSKSYFNAQTGHFEALGSESQPKSCRVRFCYVRKFLAGQDEKTRVDDNRIFYQRRLVSRRI
jgi:hypothetical protein